MNAKRQILIKILGDNYKTNDEYLFYCPYCKHHKKKLSVNIDKNVYKCWVCDTNGRNLRRVVRRFGTFAQLQEWDLLTNKVNITDFEHLFDTVKDVNFERTSLPDEFNSLVSKNIPLTSLLARKYLKDRGITKEDILYWKIGYCVSGYYANRIIVPSFDQEGYVNYFIARTYNGSWKKYLNPSVSKDIIFNELYVDWDDDLIITEGVFDAIIAGRNSVPLLGSTLKESSKLFQAIVIHDTPVFIALDQDAQQKEQRIIKNFINYGVEVYKIDTSGYDDVGSMTKEVFKKRKENATFIAQDDYLLETSINAL